MPCAVFTAVTLAPTRTASLGSATLPLRLPVGTCACEPTARMMANAGTIALTIALLNIDRPPKEPQTCGGTMGCVESIPNWAAAAIFDKSLRLTLQRRGLDCPQHGGGEKCPPNGGGGLRMPGERLLRYPETPMTALTTTAIRNFIGGNWRDAAQDGLELINPATGEPLGRAPAGSAADVDAAAEAAQAAFPGWRAMPAGDRVQYLFKLKSLLEQHLDELASLITIENGKTLAEAKGELRRGIR